MIDCLFCQIVRRQSEASIVYENEYTMAFMNTRQGNPGHVLVVPKRHVETLDQLDSDLAAHLFQAVTHVARGLQAAFKPDGLNIWQSNGIAAGQEIPHIHVHLLPRRLNDKLIQFYTRMPPQEERIYLDRLAQQIRVHLD